jgi:hypothetical protein
LISPPIRPRQNRSLNAPLSPARDRTPAWLARRAGSRRQHAAGCWRSRWNSQEVRHHGGLKLNPIESAAAPKATEQPPTREDLDSDTRLSRKAVPARCGSSPAGSGVYARRSGRGPKVVESQIGLHAADPFGLARQLGGGHHRAFIGKRRPKAFQLKQDRSPAWIGRGLRGALAVRGFLPRIDRGSYRAR